MAGVATTISLTFPVVADARPSSVYESENPTVEFIPISDGDKVKVRPEIAIKASGNKKDTHDKTTKAAPSSTKTRSVRESTSKSSDDYLSDISVQETGDGLADYSGGGIILPPGFDTLGDDIEKSLADVDKKARDRISKSGLPMIDPIRLDDIDIPYIKDLGDRAVRLAYSKLGSPYVWAATGPDTFDCSGLMQWIYSNMDISIPRLAADQVSQGTPVALNDLKPGDLVGYNNGGHVAMYIGDGKVIHAPQTGDVVKISPVDMQPIDGAARWIN